MNIFKSHYLRVVYMHFNDIEIAVSQLLPGRTEEIFSQVSIRNTAVYLSISFILRKSLLNKTPQVYGEPNSFSFF